MKSATVKVEGLKELDEALADFSKATARGVLRRAGLKAIEPMADKARELAPYDQGWLRRSIKTSANISNKIGKAEYAEVMKSGGSRTDAVQALRDARRDASGGSFAVVYMGVANVSKRNSIKANVQEFGGVRQAPQAYMRPAFEQTKGAVMSSVKELLAAEIDKAAQRAARKAVRLATRGK